MAETHGPEKAINGNYPNHLSKDYGNEEALNRIRTAESISISPELFEKIYLSPQNNVKGNLRKTFGNPTPICLIGFLMSLTPLACDLLGWRGAGGNGAASTGAYFGFGAILMTVGGLLEWVLGNTFPAVVFCSFGAFWFAYGGVLVPSFNSYGAYATANSPAASGLQSPAFASSLAFFLLWMGFMCMIYLIASLRTNLVFVTIFFGLLMTFAMLSAEFWYLAMGDMASGARLQTAGGSFAFVTCIAGWYIFAAQVLAAVDFPLSLPVGDMSTVIKGGTDRKATKETHSA